VAIHAETSNERNRGLGQKGALHVRTCAKQDRSRDLPKDVIRRCSVPQVHFHVRVLSHGPRNLNDEDAIAVKVDVTGEMDACGKYLLPDNITSRLVLLNCPIASRKGY
jgi:hypothetical protein